MNERLDYILNLLTIGHHLQGRANFISESFEKAGYGSIEPYLQKLISKGYVDEVAGSPTIYKLNERGTTLHFEGGFVHHAEIMRERRVAVTCSAFTVIGFTALVFFFLHQW